MQDEARVGELLSRIDAEADPTTAAQLARYFQVRPGGYGEGDRFVGVKLSRIRHMARPYVRAPLSPADLSLGLRSPIHEHRLACLVLLAEYAKRARRAGDEAQLTETYESYVDHLDQVDNWDLVDCSAPDVVGGYLLDRDRAPLYAWVRSESVWVRRIALVATYRLLRAGQAADTYALATEVLGDRHDLLHKAAGWMLREPASGSTRPNCGRTSTATPHGCRARCCGTRSSGCPTTSGAAISPLGADPTPTPAAGRSG